MVERQEGCRCLIECRWASPKSSGFIQLLLQLPNGYPFQCRVHGREQGAHSTDLKPFLILESVSAFLAQQKGKGSAIPASILPCMRGSMRLGVSHGFASGASGNALLGCCAAIGASHLTTNNQ